MKCSCDQYWWILGLIDIHIKYLGCCLYFKSVDIKILPLLITVAFYLSRWVCCGCIVHHCTSSQFSGTIFNPILFFLQSGEVGDLSFNAGEVILVVKKEGDWWHGIINQTSGIFPSNYVELLPNQVRCTDCLCGFIGG